MPCNHDAKGYHDSVITIALNSVRSDRYNDIAADYYILNCKTKIVECMLCRLIKSQIFELRASMYRCLLRMRA